MNEPFNIDEDGMFYDVPPTPPHTLTDERAGYGEPSEAALAFARDWLKSASKIEGITEALATLFDAFAAQQVEAREAEIVEALERYLAGCYQSQETARQIGYLESAARYDTEIAAYETTIAVVKREL